MSYEIKILKRRSVCPFCNYGQIKDDVPLGKQYNIVTESIEQGALICGGCHKVTILTICQVYEGGFLPYDIFRELQ